MAENRKYYYMKLKENFFESDSMTLLESMHDGMLYSNILLKMYLKSLKNEGKLLLNNMIPYNAQMIATITRHQVGTVEKALDTFEKLGLIDILDNGTIYMADIELMIGQSSTEGERKKRARLINKKKAEQLADKCPPSISDICPLEIEKEIEKEIEIERENRVNYQLIADMYNDTCVSFPHLRSLTDKRKKTLKARLRKYTLDDFKTLFEKAECSSFLKGSNSRDWSATFDWLIKDSNMAKVLEGNYDDKDNKKSSTNNSGYDLSHLRNNNISSNESGVF